MTPEAFRAAVLSGMDSELAHPWLSGLTTQQRHIVESVEQFFKSEVTTDQLTVMAGRVTG